MCVCGGGDGHTTIICCCSITYPHCSQDGLDAKSCENSELCINFKGDHATCFHFCHIWKLEKQIFAIKIIKKIIFFHPEAGKHDKIKIFSVGVFCSSLFKQQLKSIGTISTQTDFSFPLRNTCITIPSNTPKGKTCNVYCTTKRYV